MDPKQLPLSRAIEGYFIAAHARRLSPHTLRDYDNTFRKFETFLGRDPPLADITPGHIRAFLQHHTNLSAKTLRNYHTNLSALWTWALKEGLVDRHVVRAIPPPRPERRDIAPYTQRDIEAMLAACERTRTYVRPGVRPCDNSRPTAPRARPFPTHTIKPQAFARGSNIPAGSQYKLSDAQQPITIHSDPLHLHLFRLHTEAQFLQHVHQLVAIDQVDGGCPVSRQSTSDGRRGIRK